MLGWPKPRGQQGRGAIRDTTKQGERLIAIRLRYTTNVHLDDLGLTAPPDIARAVGLPAAEAVRLLNRRQWREGDAAALRAVATRLGLNVPLEDLEASDKNGGAR